MFSEKGLTLKTGFINVQGREIYYAVAGNDSLPTLYFIHGSPGTWSAFIDYMYDSEMLSHYRMVGLDRPGFGYSTAAGALHLEEQSQIMLHMVTRLSKGKPVYIAGHSLGAPLALKMAAKGQNQVAGIALISASLDPSLEPKESWRSILNTIPFRFLLPGAFRPSNDELIYFKSDVVKLAEDFNNITCKVMLIHGEQDKWVPVANVDYAVKNLRKATAIEKIIIPGANHFIPFTEKEEIKTGLVKMLASDSDEPEHKR